MTSPGRWLVLLLLAGVLNVSSAAGGEVLDILTKYCGKCHHDKKLGNVAYDVQSLDSLTTRTPTKRVLAKYPAAKGYVVPPDLAASLVWLRAGAAEKPDMPPRGQPSPTDAEKQAIKAWIENGAKWEDF